MHGGKGDERQRERERGNTRRGDINWGRDRSAGGRHGVCIGYGERDGGGFSDREKRRERDNLGEWERKEGH